MKIFIRTLQPAGVMFLQRRRRLLAAEVAFDQLVFSRPGNTYDTTACNYSL